MGLVHLATTSTRSMYHIKYLQTEETHRYMCTLRSDSVASSGLGFVQNGPHDLNILVRTCHHFAVQMIYYYFILLHCKLHNISIRQPGYNSINMVYVYTHIYVVLLFFSTNIYSWMNEYIYRYTLSGFLASGWLLLLLLRIEKSASFFEWRGDCLNPFSRSHICVVLCCVV